MPRGAIFFLENLEFGGEKQAAKSYSCINLTPEGALGTAPDLFWNP